MNWKSKRRKRKKKIWVSIFEKKLGLHLEKNFRRISSNWDFKKNFWSPSLKKILVSILKKKFSSYLVELRFQKKILVSIFENFWTPSFFIFYSIVRWRIKFKVEMTIKWLTSELYIKSYEGHRNIAVERRWTFNLCRRTKLNLLYASELS